MTEDGFEISLGARMTYFTYFLHRNNTRRKNVRNEKSDERVTNALFETSLGARMTYFTYFYTETTLDERTSETKRVTNV